MYYVFLTATENENVFYNKHKVNLNRAQDCLKIAYTYFINMNNILLNNPPSYSFLFQ